MHNADRQPTEKLAGADARHETSTGPPEAEPADTGVVVAGPMARSLANGDAGKMDPTVEDAYWETNYSKQEYVERGAPYTTYRPAFRTGYEGRSRYPGKQFEAVETQLRDDYDKARGNSTLSWEQAKRATRDAWNRVDAAVSMGTPSLELPPSRGGVVGK